MTDELHEDLVALADRAHVPPVDLARLEHQARGRARRRGLGAAVVVLLVAGTAGVGAWQALPGQDRTEVLASDPAGADALTRPGQPGLPFATLAVNGVEPTACGTDASPLVLAATPGAETADTPEAVALRQVLETGIQASFFPPKQDWVRMTSSQDAVTYGHRHGPVGIDQVITLKWTDGAWTFDRTAPCLALTYGSSEAATISVWTEKDSSLSLEWSGASSTCAEGGNGAYASVQETAAEVRVVLAPREPVPLTPPVEVCLASGRSETTQVPLTAPVGERKVINVGYAPGRDVPSRSQSDAFAARQSAAITDAQTLCDAAATTLGLTATYSFYEDNFYNPMNVGIIRGALPDLPLAWAQPPADTPAAQCFLQGPAPADDPRPNRTVAVAASSGLPPFIYNDDYRSEGARERLGDPPN